MTDDRNQPNTYIITVLLIGLFSGLGGLFYFLNHTFLTIDMAALLVIIAGSLAVGVHFLFFKRNERYLTEVLIYCYAGWGPFIIALMLALNFVFHGKPVQKQYELKGNQEMDIAMMPTSFEVNIEDHQFDDFEYLLTIHEDEIKCGRFAKEVWITEAKGIFGLKVILGKELH